MHAPKAHKQYHFPLVVDDLNNNSLDCKGHGSHFTLLNMCHKEWKEDIPSIMICTWCDGTENYDDLIATLAHEFGHYLSWSEGTELGGPYSRYLSGKPFSDKTSQAVLTEEKLAWQYGFQFLEDNDIEVTSEMIAVKESALRCYNRFSRKQTAKYYGE